MPAAVSPRPRAAGWRSLLLLALASASLPAAAQSMACGTYKDSNGNTTLTLESEGHGFLSGPYQATEELRIARQEDVLGTGNLSTGQLENWYFSDNDRTISTPYREFTREHAAACKTMPQPVEGGCVMNTSECLEALPEAAPVNCTPGAPRAWAQPACACWRPTSSRPRTQRPEGRTADSRDLQGGAALVRRRGLHDGSQGDCLGMMGKALLGLQHSVDAPLPPAQLDELIDLAACNRAKRSAPTPPNLVEQWPPAGGPRCAAAILCTARGCPGLRSGQRPCRSRQRPRGSAHAGAGRRTALWQLEAERSVLSQLRFLEGGVVEAGGREQPLRASLRDGRILIHRDIGSDFVLQLLQNGNLVGIDSGNRSPITSATGGRHYPLHTVNDAL